MRWGVSRGFLAHPRESRRLRSLMRSMEPTILWSSLSSVCINSMIMVARVSLIEASSDPNSESGRKRRGEEHEAAIRMRFFMMHATLASIASSSVSRRGTMDR